MASFDELNILGYDYLEFAVQDLDSCCKLYDSFGFQRAGARDLPKLKSQLFFFFYVFGEFD